MAKTDYRFLAENSVDLICKVGADLVMHYASPSCQQLLGWRPDEMEGKGPDAFVHPDDLPVVAAAHRLLLKNGVDRSPTAVRMRKKSGEYAWLEVNARIVHGPGSGEADSIVLTMRDITHRVAQVQREALFHQTFALAPVPMMVAARADFRLIDVNDAFVTTFGHAANDVIGLRATDSGLLDKPTCEQVVAAFGTATSVLHIEIGTRARDGRRLHCLMSADPISMDGQPCMLVALRELTQQKHSDGQLIAAVESVMSDVSWFGRAFLEELAQVRQETRVDEPTAHELAELTTREYDVLRLICEGLSDGHIAETLSISRNTVRNHVARIYGKIDVHQRGAAIVWARERGVNLFGASPRSKRRGGRR